MLIRGNHDTDLTAYHSTINIDRVHFEHGNRADLTSWQLVHVLSTWWNVRVLRFIYRKNPERLRKLLLTLVGTYAGGYRANANTMTYLKYALKHLSDGQDMVVLGHTHQMQNIELYFNGQQKYYLNCGASFEHLEGYVIDTQTLEYKIIRPDRRKS